MNSKEQTLVISPIGELGADGDLLGRLGKDLCERFGFPTDICPLLDEKDLWLDPVRKQYHSTPILETLAMISPPQAVKVLALTKVDLFIPILTHVYGEAQLGGKACILSTYRFSYGPALPDRRETFHCRLVKEAVHELGHTFKLRHCKDPACVMHYCRSVTEVDRKSNEFCRYCTVLLQDELKNLAKDRINS